jgi:hypothetical protein
LHEHLKHQTSNIKHAMSAAIGGVAITPSKRWVSPDEPLDPADINMSGRPLMQLNANSVGADEVVTQDVIDMITEEVVGRRITWTTASDFALNAGINREMKRLALLGLQRQPAIECTQVPGLNVEFNAYLPDDATVAFCACYNAATGTVTVPAGTAITAIVFAARRTASDQSAPPALNDPGTGYLLVKNTKSWREPTVQVPAGEGISTTGLDQMCTGVTASVAPDSIGRREIDPDGLARVASSVSSGLAFKFKSTSDVNLAANSAWTYSPAVAVTGALTTHAAVMGRSERILSSLLWNANVSSTGNVSVTVHNISPATLLIPRGTKVNGELL